MGILIVIFTIFAIFLVSWGVFLAFGPSGYTLRGIITSSVSTPKKSILSLLYFLLSPFIFLGRFIFHQEKWKQKISRNLKEAKMGVSLERFLGIRVFFLFIFLFIVCFVIKPFNPFFLIIGLFLSIFLPDFYVKKKLSAYKKSIADTLPETVDIIGLCIEAGLDFTTSTRWAIEKISSNPFLTELKFVLEEINWGKPRIEALKGMSRRLEIAEVSSFVQTLVQAERMGTPVAEAFAILSEDAREQRYYIGEAKAMKAPIKMLFPLIFCILPVIGIIVGGPILLQFMQGGIFKSF